MINLNEIKNNIFRRENFFYLIVILSVFGGDRILKNLVLEKFNENTYYINNFLNFDLLWNTGIGFGLFSSNSSLFYNFTSGVIATVIFFLIMAGLQSDKFDKITFSIIIGGALGNFYDRIVFNAVPDFIDIHYKNFHWFTFNLADIFITLGIILLICKSIVIKK